MPKAKPVSLHPLNFERLSMRSCVLILCALVLSLSAASLGANQSESAEPVKSKSSSPPARDKQKSSPRKKSDVSQKIPPASAEPLKIATQPTPDPKQQPIDNKPEQPYIEWFWPPVWSNWALVLAAIVTARIALRTLKVIERQADAARDAAAAALEEARAITMSERAYVKMTHLPPGLHFEEGGWYWVQLRIQNSGRTPARITARCINTQYFSPSEAPPGTPDYSEGVVDTVGAFLVTGDHVGNTLRAQFPGEEAESNIRAGHGRFLIFGYVDYIDQFRQRHRAGYGREYSALLDDPENYPAEDFPRRSNLVFVPEFNYNYDRLRQRGEGHDWNEPV